MPQERPTFSTTVTEEHRQGSCCGQGCLAVVRDKHRQKLLSLFLSLPLPLSPEDALQHYTGGNLTVTGPKETASIFATYPSPYLSLNNGFLDQVSVEGRAWGTESQPLPCFLGPQPIIRLVLPWYP